MNQKANKKLKELFLSKGIIRCEKCGSDMWLGFAHRHKRRWYYDKPEETLWDFSQVLLLDLKCHQEIEYDSGKAEELFIRLRGKDTPQKL